MPGAMWKTVASYLGKHTARSAMPRKNAQPIVAVAFAEVEVESGQNE